MSLIAAEGLAVDQGATRVLSGVDFHIDKGEIVAARLLWPGRLAAGQVEDAVLASRHQGSRRGTVRFSNGEDALVDRLPRAAQQKSCWTSIMGSRMRTTLHPGGRE